MGQSKYPSKIHLDCLEPKYSEEIIRRYAHSIDKYVKGVIDHGSVNFLPEELKDDQTALVARIHSFLRDRKHRSEADEITKQFMNEIHRQVISSFTEHRLITMRLIDQFRTNIVHDNTYPTWLSPTAGAGGVSIN
jgi:hypothetical protein